MATEEILDVLKEQSEVLESYVLVREVKLILSLNADEENKYYPELKIKVWKSYALVDYPYYFTVSHNVWTPSQAGPYYPSNTHATSEAGAIKQAISTTTSFLNSALREGLEMEDKWMVENPNF